MMCGWCMHNAHEKCPRKIRRWLAEHKKVGKVTKFVVTYLDDYNYCDCKVKSHTDLE